MFFSSAPPKTDSEQSLSLEIPPAPDRDLQTRTLSVAPAGSAAPAVAAPTATTTPGSGDRLASVDIASRRPTDVETQPQAPAAATPTVTKPPVTPPSAPVKPVATAPKPAAAAAPPVPSTPLPTGTAARGAFTVNLSAYADKAKADALVQKVRAMGYPVATAAVTQAGKPLTRVTAGPFDTRAAAEAARLKIRAAVPSAPASLAAEAHDQKGDAPAAALPAGRAGGWAVQLGAFSNEADANRLRDRVRGAGVAGYVDSIASSAGAKLFRVRAGPQTQRDDALKVRDQLKAKLGVDGNVVTVP